MTGHEHMLARLKKCDCNVWGKNGLIHCITGGPIRYRRNASGSYVKDATEKLVHVLDENEKFRELCTELYKCATRGADCSKCAEDNDGHACAYVMRELGIEVDE